MSAAEQYWAELYAQAEVEAEFGDTAAPAQDSPLGRQFYYLYLGDVDEDVAS